MILVVNYHYIRADFTQAYPAIFGVTPAGFRHQLETLSQYGNFISQNDLNQRVVKGESLDSSKMEFLVTFDDGLQEQYIEALPILDEMGIPAIFYVNSVNFEDYNFSLVHQIHLLRSQISSSEFLNLLSSFSNLSAEEMDKAVKHYRYDDEETARLKYILNFKLTLREQEEIINKQFPLYFTNVKAQHQALYMSHDQLKSLASKSYLGSHNHKHIPLGLYSKEEIFDQISQSKIYLESLTQSQIVSISYPYGSKEACADPVPEMAQKAGMSFGFTTERAALTTLSNQFLLPRFNCNDLPGGKSNIFPDFKIERIQGSTWS